MSRVIGIKFLTLIAVFFAEGGAVRADEPGDVEGVHADREAREEGCHQEDRRRDSEAAAVRAEVDVAEAGEEE